LCTTQLSAFAFLPGVQVEALQLVLVLALLLEEVLLASA
jgi:hypothetical protein